MIGNGETPQRSRAATPDWRRESEEEKGRLEVGVDEGLVSRYIKILEIYGRVVQWSCAGGRRYVRMLEVIPFADTNICAESRNILLGIRNANSTSCDNSISTSNPVSHANTP